MNRSEDWGYFSPAAEARLQNMMGLQTFNSIRALDFLSGLPDVDPQRIAVTGASGGGTQTFILCAIDPRPAVAFPAVMVSTAMQGGCTCENACYLRIGTSNVEFAALFAPRPLGLTAANDWTKQMPSKGFPELKQHYEMFGAGDRVMLYARTEFGHNYNYPSRAAMYGWLNRHLGLGCEEPIVEQDYRPLSREEMSVWDAEHPRPPGGPDHERKLLRWITADSQKQIDALLPRDEATWRAYRRVVGLAVDVMIGRGLTPPEQFEKLYWSREEYYGWPLVKGLLCHPQRGEQLPLVCLLPRQRPPSATVIWIDRSGKQGLFDASGRPNQAIQQLLSAGARVFGIDLLGQGELTGEGKPLVRVEQMDAEYAGYTYGYNPPVFSRRVHDVLSLISLVRGEEPQAGQVVLVGLGGAGHWVAAACAQAPAAVDAAVIDTAGFRFADLQATDHPDFLPGAVKYGDLPALIALAAPTRLWLAGEGSQVPRIIEAAYQAAGKRDRLSVFHGRAQQREAAAVRWLVKLLLRKQEKR